MQRNQNSNRKRSGGSKNKTGQPYKTENKGPRKPGQNKSVSNRPRPKNKPNTLDDGIRLNRYIANAGVCSRREAESYIEAGVVTINGKVVTELGTKVKFGDVVRFNDAPLTPEKKTYLLLNKPKGYVTTLDDPQARKTVMDLIQAKCKERVYPVGRLDMDTTGVLLLTNDGELAEKLAHPRSNKKKIYQVTLDNNITEEELQKLYQGIELEDGPIKADRIAYVEPGNKKEVGIEIHSGRNRIIRRMFEHLGYKVNKLDRVYFAGLTKKNVPRGKSRFLSEKEINMLKRGLYS